LGAEQYPHHKLSALMVLDGAGKPERPANKEDVLDGASFRATYVQAEGNPGFGFGRARGGFGFGGNVFSTILMRQSGAAPPRRSRAAPSLR
jgi:hypothetical protein